MNNHRISHIIPTITCSNCQAVLPIGELSNHECEALPTKPSTPLKLDTSFPSLHERYFSAAANTSTTSPLDQVPELMKSKDHHHHHRHHSQKKTRPKINGHLHRSPSTESGNSTSNETWKIARRPTGSSITSGGSITSPLSALSRSFSIESSTSPTTPKQQQQPYLSFRVSPGSPADHEPPTTISFFKMPTVSKLSPHLLHRQQDKHIPPCFRCKRNIRSNPISIGSKYMYHSHCLTCYLCRDPLNPQKAICEYNGMIYCSKDYQQFIQSRPTCATCDETIDPPTRPSKAFGRYYHPEHLRCTQCHKPVDEHTTGIVRHKQRIYCRPDFNALYLPTCRGCGRAVEREAVSAADGKLTGKWHTHCFKCHACAEPFDNKTFYVHDNHPYCQRDYHRLNHSLCAKCDLPIEGRCAQTGVKGGDGDKYHPHCFTCHKCEGQIKDIYYNDKHQRIYCPDHGLHQSDKRTTIFCDLSSGSNYK